ncbi:MAG TPA: HYR domain-containing protein [Blastocatellia bacterium]|nr:HYR domain-containing protein [Blastocatellia bacterium]
MENSKEQRRSKTGRLLIGGIAFLIVIAFLQVGLRHGAAGGGQKIVGGHGIKIDVNPGGSKTIDLASRDYLPVAVLGAKDFDVSSINQSSLSFAGAPITKKGSARRASGNEKRTRPAKPRYDVEIRDVNKDGINDLVVRFPIAFMRDISAGTPQAILKGRLNDGSTIEAYETVVATGQSPIRMGGGVNAPAGITQFCNSTPIVFPPEDGKGGGGAGNATPYPSQITVSGATTSITGVSVTLNDVSHTNPDDLHIILVSPDNRVLVLDNGAWDSTDAVNVDVTFSSSATNYPPADSPLVSGTYKPVSYFAERGLDSPAPALSPAAPYAYTFNAFNGINANGTWSLYARDEVTGDTGMIGGGWCISFPVETPGCNNQLFSGSLVDGDATQPSRLFQDGLAALCGSTGKACPETVGGKGDMLYDTYTVTNNNTISACMTASITQSCFGNTGLAIYQGSYDSTNLCMNYLNDDGQSLTLDPTSETQTMSLTLAPGQSVVLVVFALAPGKGCGSYGVLVEGNLCSPSVGCTLTCPANVTQSNDPNQCGAVVNYPPPLVGGFCTDLMPICSPASGSFFPKGTTTVTCTLVNNSPGPVSCTFTVTVNDTQPPTITCPANMSVVGVTCQNVTYTTPTPTDNCPGATASCSPPSGTCFPVGTTTVTCTAKDTSTNMAMCNFTVTVGGCTGITCPANITQSNDPNQCGAVVNYPAPMTSGSCGTATCSPLSGSFFPKGTTTVTCSTTAGPSCPFTVTVNDTQPPSITCPANVTSVSPAVGSGGVVTYPTPTASDNCPGVTTACTPPSGSTFALGTTTVTCTATDTSGNTATCSFSVSVFDGRLQDDSEGCNNTVLFNTVTGEYRWCCHGTIFTGRAKVTRAGNTYSLSQSAADRRVQINLNAGASTPNGNASLQVPVGKTICVISDRDIRNDTCLCGGAAPPTAIPR